MTKPKQVYSSVFMHLWDWCAMVSFCVFRLCESNVHAREHVNHVSHVMRPGRTHTQTQRLGQTKYVDPSARTPTGNVLSALECLANNAHTYAEEQCGEMRLEVVYRPSPHIRYTTTLTTKKKKRKKREKH